jgi:hypothetical protein
VPPTKKSPRVEKKNIEVPPKVVRVLKLVDKEESDAERHVEAIPEQTPHAKVPAKESDVEKPVEQTLHAKVPAEESDVQVIEAPVIKIRKLKRGAEPTAPAIEPAAPVVEVVAPAVGTTNMAGFLAARRGQALPSFMPRVEEVAAFLANEPILPVPVNAVGLVEEPLKTSEGSIPFMLDRPLGSNIHHILEDLEMGFEGSVGMADNNLGPSTTAATQTPRKPLSTIPETRASF